MKIDEIIADFKRGIFSDSHFFNAFNEVSRRIFSSEENARKLMLSLMDYQSEVSPKLSPVMSTLLARLGLFPYMKNLEKMLVEDLNYEFHRSSNLKDIVFHSEQFKLACKINDGESVIVSAPTSFGKSLLIQEVVSSNKYENIVIIEPTLALVDETREKLRKNENGYKIIFSRTQKKSRKNIFLFTQERLLEYPDLPRIDYFIIDEFYKLSLEQDERSSVLNHAFYFLTKQTKSFYLLGPRIESISEGFEEKVGCSFYKTDFETVNITREYLGDKRSPKKLHDLLCKQRYPTLIYMKGPGFAESNAIDFSRLVLGNDFEQHHGDIIEWINKNIDKGWSLINLLKKGIGFHHGELPRHIGKYIVNSFNKGHIKYLFCTSTLIEGVNTTAKSVIVYHSYKGKAVLTDFDLNNIAGRAGRMGSYFNGSVFIFGKEPVQTQTHVDIPWFTQGNASDELLVQIDEKDLNALSKQKMKEYSSDKNLSFDVIKKNSNISPMGQIKLAKHISENRLKFHKSLYWTNYPKGEQLKFACELIWDYLLPSKSGGSKEIDGVLSGAQLAFFISQFQQTKNIKDLISQFIKRDSLSVDQAVRRATKFQKKWIEFRFPKLLMGLHNIQEEVYKKNGLPAGSYKFYSSEIELGFVPEAFSALVELGVPFELIKKIYQELGSEYDDVDQVLKAIKIKENVLEIEPYERGILKALGF